MAPTNSTSPPTDPAWTIDPNRDCTCAPRNRHREDSEMPAPPFRRTDDGCRKSEPQPQPIVCRRVSNRSVRSLNRRRRRPAARCPDDPSENSAFPFRLTWTRAVPAERGAFQVERSVLRAIYQRTQITQPVAGGLRRREFRLLKCKRLSRPCLQVRKITTKIKVLNV